MERVSGAGDPRSQSRTRPVIERRVRSRLERRVKGCTRPTAATERRLVQELPTLGTIKSSNAHCFNKRRIEVTEIDSHPVPAPRGRLPVRDATTRCASTQRKALVTPYVAVDASLTSGDLYLARLIVSPQP